MSLETGTFVQDLQQANPPGTDKKKQGDDHLRLIKSVLKNTFPNATRAQYFSRARAVSASGAIAATDMAGLIVVDATAGAINLSLPALAASDDGWYVSVVKIDASANVVTATGTVNGAVNMATGTQYRMMIFEWTGTAWLGTFTVNAQAPLPTALIADDAITNVKMADNSVNTAELVALAVTSAKLADNAVATAKIVDLAVTNAKLAGPRMTMQFLTTVAAGQTYTTPANCKSVLFWVVGSGGGGGAQNTNNGNPGGDTTFNGVVAKGGSGGLNGANNNSAAGGTGGSGSATARFPGSAGQAGQNGADFSVAGSTGASGIWGLGAGQGTTGGGGSGATGTGAGGAGGGGQNTGGGGGAGEQFFLLIQNPAATYNFTITNGGTGGAAGGQFGGNGGSGGVYAFEFY